MKLIYIIGKSSAGKDTIYNVLKQKMDIDTYVMYTTRPIREGEIDGQSYNFITMKEMQEYIDGKKEDKLIEYRTYNTVYGPWIYATISDSQFKSNKDILMVGTLESYVKVKANFDDDENIQLLPIYVEVPDNIRLRRAIEREEIQKEPKYTELCRRFIADTNDFSEQNLQKAGICKRFLNNNLEDCVEEILEYINKQKMKENEESKR